MLSHNVLGACGLVIKLDVYDLTASANWYEQKLGLIPDHAFDTPTWRQFTFPGQPGVALGLNQGGQPGTGGAVVTWVVRDVDQARRQLGVQGVAILKTEQVEHGVRLCYFQDPDGNQLALRQNGP